MCKLPPSLSGRLLRSAALLQPRCMSQVCTFTVHSGQWQGCRNAGHVDMSSRKMQQINSFSRRWSKPGLANLLEVEVAGRLSGSCPTQIPTSPLQPGPSSHRSWVKQAGCEWKPATQVRSTFLQPFTQLLDELVLPGGVGRNKTRSFCSRARLRVAMCPYSCSTWVCSFKVLTSPFFTLSPSALLLLSPS